MLKLLKYVQFLDLIQNMTIDHLFFMLQNTLKKVGFQKEKHVLKYVINPVFSFNVHCTQY